MSMKDACLDLKARDYRKNRWVHLAAPDKVNKDLLEWIESVPTNSSVWRCLNKKDVGSDVLRLVSCLILASPDFKASQYIITRDFIPGTASRYLHLIIHPGSQQDSTVATHLRLIFEHIFFRRTLLVKLQER
ncbi:hypothetical protein C8R44DRAFT_736383 [Mycena epipterygia]|nr:hypothetical protein C8R44DRAFT_736383 [Mycena epipterygia]